MQAIILAAGMGKRLKELTENTTKCMVKVNGVTMIERMLAQLDKFHLSRIVLVVGYKSEYLIKFIKTLDVKAPVVYVENIDYYKTNNIYSLYLAREYLCKEDTLLLESDLIFEDCVLQSLFDDPRPSLALVSKYESWMDGTVITVRDDYSISEFLDKKHFRFADIKNYYKTVNIYKFGREFSATHYVPFLDAYIQALGNNEYYEQVLKVITKLDNSELRAKVLEKGDWYEIDDIQDLDIAESIFTENEADRLHKIQSRYGGYWRYPHMLDFCYLVNPYFPPQKLLDEMKANFEILTREYPSGQRINDLLSARFFEVSLNKIVTGNGAAELIKSLLGMINGKIGNVIPTFEEYPNRKKDDLISFKPSCDGFTYIASELMDFFESKPIDAMVVINPDNPSGNYIPYENIIKLAEWTSNKNIKLILDESFIDFAGINNTLLKNDVLNEFPNLIVIKSISKSYGVPGLRLGVLACGDEDLINAIRKDVSIWNINSFAEFYLQIAEKYKSDFKNAIDRFIPLRDTLFNNLEKVPFLKPIPSKGNYITCKVLDGVSASNLTRALLAQHNIFIKDLSGKAGIDGEYIRVSVRAPEENAKLIMGIEAFVMGLK